MFTQVRTINKDLDSLSADVQSLINATAEAADDKVKAARKRLAMLVSEGERAYEQIEDGAVKTVKSAQAIVRNNPVKAISMAIGVGVAVGAMLYRRGR